MARALNTLRKFGIHPQCLPEHAAADTSDQVLAALAGRPLNEQLRVLRITAWRLVHGKPNDIELLHLFCKQTTTRYPAAKRRLAEVR